ncbi:MAG: hypothetical protein JST70_13865 [Bacteroidetes bacterium]|nr:hypothetical protein [Bacteroidota bacterium]
MSLKLNTKVAFQGLMALLVFVASLILSQQSMAYPVSGKMIPVEQITAPMAVSADEQTDCIIKPHGDHVDIHVRALTKIKGRSLVNKGNNIAQALQSQQRVPVVITNTPIYINWSGIVRPDYYLFLFRYTLF